MYYDCNESLIVLASLCTIFAISLILCSITLHHTALTSWTSGKPKLIPFPLVFIISFLLYILVALAVTSSYPSLVIHPWRDIGVVTLFTLWIAFLSRFITEKLSVDEYTPGAVMYYSDIIIGVVYLSRSIYFRICHHPSTSHAEEETTERKGNQDVTGNPIWRKV